MSIIVIACKPGDIPADKHESISINKDFLHLEFLITLKDSVAKNSWPDFARQKVVQPIVYYTKKGTYIINPNEHIRSITNFTELEPILEDIPAILLPETYTDTLNFQFSSSYSDNDTSALYYRENILSFASFELTQAFIPDIVDIQDWSIMVIHELFHGFQRSIPAHKAYYTSLEIPGGPDEFLAAYHRDLNWYKESIIQENELLKGVWMEGKGLVESLTQYEALRTKRINRILSEYKVDIREIEDYEIMIEGHARYFESLCKRYLSDRSPDSYMLEAEDLALISDMYHNYRVENDKGLYDLYNDRYYYQIGFNISMILEKYLPDYSSSVYKTDQNFNRYLEYLMSQSVIN